MSLMNRILSLLGRTAKDVATDLLRDQRKEGGGPASGPAPSRPAAKPEPGARGTTTGPGRGAGRRPGPRPAAAEDRGSRSVEAVGVYDVEAVGLPAFTYSPAPDGDADPGEVVWTWVPYEEDTTKGKDRPVLVLARSQGRLVVAQLTSKDHDRDAAQEASWGRYWFDIGSGPWDRRGRPSEMRLDRLLLVDPEAVRREGATLARETFEAAAQALREHWA